MDRISAIAERVISRISKTIDVGPILRWSGRGGDHGRKAISLIIHRGSEGEFSTDKYGKVNGVVAYEVRRSGNPPSIYIQEIGVQKEGKGIGTKLIRKIERMYPKFPLMLVAAPGSGGFWSKMGFEPAHPDSYLMVKRKP